MYVRTWCDNHLLIDFLSYYALFSKLENDDKDNQTIPICKYYYVCI
jgi:hypothetical protein